MNSKALLSLSFLLIAGCATGPNISGHRPKDFGPSAEKVWTEQLQRGLDGHKNFAVVRAVRGKGGQLGDDSETRSVKVGAMLSEDQKIETSPSSQIDLFLGDNGPVLRMMENSSINIVRLRKRPINKTVTVVDTMIELNEGRLLGNVKKLAAESSYLIRTRNSVLKIRGTEFMVYADGRVSIVVGSAQVFHNARVHMVNAGETYDPNAPVQTASR